jgi:hypothetical protein
LAEFDRSSKWLIEHHGDAILRLAGFGRPVRWRAVQPELVHVGQTPDGTVEVEFEDSTEAEKVVLEIATFPEQRAVEQMARDAAFAFLAWRFSPEMVVVVLRPKGRFRVPNEVFLHSKRGTSGLQVYWRVVELWMVPAEELLATDDPGMMPWVPLADFPGPPGPVVRRCSEIIRMRAAETERADLFAVTQVLMKLRYNDPTLFQMLGGRRAMIESPLLEEIRAEGRAEGSATILLRTLAARFGTLPERVEQRVRGVRDEKRLQALAPIAATCAHLEEFEAALG